MSNYFGTPRDARENYVFKDNSRLMPSMVDPFSEETYTTSDSEQVSRGANMPKRMRATSDSEQVSRGANMPKRMRATSDSDDGDDYVLLDQDAPRADEGLVLDDEYSEPVEEIQGDSNLLMGSTIPGNLLDAVEQRLDENLRFSDSPRESPTDEESLSSAEVEPANEEAPTEEAMAEWRDGLMSDFQKIMGSSYDPNSSMDIAKMKILADFKRANPNLSTNALALKIYRSGAL
jgi:hypothetical protein